MVKELHVVVPGELRQRTGGYMYDARVVDGLRARGATVRVHELEGSFPEGDGEARDSFARVLDELPRDAVVVVDGLALGCLPGPAETHAARLRLLGLVHHPLFEETGVDDAERERLRDSERRSLEACRGVICTSDFTTERVREAFGVPHSRLRVAEPGTVPARRARGPRPGDPPRLASVGSVIPRKGYDALLEALVGLREHPWEWVVAGTLTADPEFADALRREISEAGLEDRVDLRGEVERDQIRSILDSASLFVLPSHYEGYGMAFAEAMARGLPIVSTTGGAIPHTVPDDAGLLVAPGDPEVLRSALASLLGPAGEERRAALAERARCHGRELPGWDRTVRDFARAVRELAGGPDIG